MHSGRKSLLLQTAKEPANRAKRSPAQPTQTSRTSEGLQDVEECRGDVSRS